VLSSKHERIVGNDNTVTFKNLILQLPATRHQAHFVRCPVTVHQFSNGTLGVSYHGRLRARYDAAGGPLNPSPNKLRAANAQRLASKPMLAGAVANHLPARVQNQELFARTPNPGESAGEKLPMTTPTQNHRGYPSFPTATL
jgi:hypothetical protein